VECRPANSVFNVILSQLQATQFKELLDESQQRTGIEGILCTVARCYDSASGGSIVELQAARLSRGAIRKIQKIIAEDLEPLRTAERAVRTFYSQTRSDLLIRP
jgi:hypothetical protein